MNQTPLALISFQDSIDKLHRKAHESSDQASVRDLASLSPSELDRLSGKTHLLVDTGSLDSRNSYYNERTHPQMVGNTMSNAWNDCADSIHPIIVQDMTYFDASMSTYSPLFFDDPTIPSATTLDLPDFNEPPLHCRLHPYTSTNLGLGGGGLQTPAALDATSASFSYL